MNPILFLVFAGFLASSSAVYYSPGVLLWEELKVTNWTEFGQNGIQIAFTRGTKGASYVDPTFSTNWGHFEKMRIMHGAYHDYDTSNTAYENFANAEKHILNVVSFTSRQLFRVSMRTNAGNLSPQSLAEDYHTFLWLVEHKYKFKPIIFTSKPFWDRAIGSAGNDYDFGAYRLWIFDDSNQSLQPEISSVWKNFVIWTFSSKGRIKGSASSYIELLWMKQ